MESDWLFHQIRGDTHLQPRYNMAEHVDYPERRNCHQDVDYRQEPQRLVNSIFVIGVDVRHILSVSVAVIGHARHLKAVFGVCSCVPLGSLHSQVAKGEAAAEMPRQASQP
mmetsp:Transcript_58795/g.116499  ORF Transcript_58795/g.116499 Transcript_58795/m.116499 type:complete len:111 (+) Transcript_58795:910-1242(+)